MFQMIGNSRTLQIILSIDMVALLMYNVSGMMVTGHMGAVFRTVLETMRTLFVWLVRMRGTSMVTRGMLGCMGLVRMHGACMLAWV